MRRTNRRTDEQRIDRRQQFKRTREIEKKNCCETERERERREEGRRLRERERKVNL